MIVQALRRLPSVRSAATPDLVADQAINDFQSETSEIVGAPDPLLARSVVFVLAGTVLLALLLAGVVKVERIVVGTGRVVSDAPTLLVQALDTSIVRNLLVREGQVVHKGDALATLDPTFSAAEVGNLKAQAGRLKAEIARIEAEQRGEPYAGSETDSNELLQMSIWRSRQAEYTSKIVSYKQKMESDEAIISRSRDDISHYEARLGVQQQVENMRKELEHLQVGSKLNSLLATDSRVEISRSLAQAQNQIQSATHEMAALKADRDVYVEQWKSTITKDLVDRRSEFGNVQERLAKAERRQDMVTLTAVQDAVVLELGKFSAGSVAQPGEKILSLVPIDSGLSIEADIAASDQGFVTPGQTVNLKFAAYRYTDHGVGHGKVRSISPDSFTPTDSKAETPQRFYRAMVDVTDLPLKNVPTDFTLVPGMTVSTDIVVGKRSILAYLMEGAVRNFSEGMREP